MNDDGDISISSTGNISTKGRYSDGIFAYVTDNGDIEVTSSGNITTEGRNAFGIAAIGNDDGDVTIASHGNITTTGRDAIGIAALVGDNGAISITSVGNVTTSGNDAIGIAATTFGDGPITINSTGSITTSGSDADGINVDSFGGSVTINQRGDVTVTGSDADAIDVDNADGAGNSTITIAAGSTITGGPGSGDGIDFQGGNINRVFNFGTITTAGENAIEGEGSGSELIFNSGIVTGNVDLGPGANAFNNQAGGIFNSGTTVNLGAGNTLTNAGIVSPGGNGTIQTTALTGNLVQTNPGQFNVDIDVGNTLNDRVNATGTAALNGNVKVQATNVSFGPKSFTILSAAGGTTDNGLGLIASPALQAGLTFPNATDVVLGVSLDFSPSAAGLNPNQTRIGNYLNAAFGAGGGTLGPIFNGLLNGVFEIEAYRWALDQLSPEVYLMTETATLFAAEEFTNNLFSCPIAGGGYAFIAEGQCVWVRPEGRFLNRNRTANNIGFDEDSGAFSAGAQVALAPGWFIGGALGYETASLNTSTGAASDSDRFNIGGVLKYQRGPMLFAAAVSGGIADFETHRHIDFGGFTAQAHSEHDVTYVAGQFRAAYLLSHSRWYAKPLVDLNLTHLNRDALNETGGGAANLDVSGGDETFFSVTPAIEFGGDIYMGGNSVLRPFIKAGVTFFNDDEHALTARFAGAPGGIGGFAIESEFDDVFADIETGVSVIDNELGSLSISYEARIAEDTDQHGVVLKGTSRF